MIQQVPASQLQFWSLSSQQSQSMFDLRSSHLKWKLLLLPKRCGQLPKIVFEKLFSLKIVFSKNCFSKNCFCEKLFFEKLFSSIVTNLEKIFFETKNCFCQKLFFEKLFLWKIVFAKNHFAVHIFLVTVISRIISLIPLLRDSIDNSISPCKELFI